MSSVGDRDCEFKNQDISVRLYNNNLNLINGNLSYEAVVKAGREAKDNLIVIDSTLPKFPDRKGIEDLLVRLNKKYLLGV